MGMKPAPAALAALAVLTFLASAGGRALDKCGGDRERSCEIPSSAITGPGKPRPCPENGLEMADRRVRRRGRTIFGSGKGLCPAGRGSCVRRQGDGAARSASRSRRRAVENPRPIATAIRASTRAGITPSRRGQPRSGVGAPQRRGHTMAPASGNTSSTGRSATTAEHLRPPTDGTRIDRSRPRAGQGPQRLRQVERHPA
jgi:hypothetical protein